MSSNSIPFSAQQKKRLAQFYRTGIQQGWSPELMNQAVERQLIRWQSAVVDEDSSKQQRLSRLKRSLPRIARITTRVLPLLLVVLGVAVLGVSLGPVGWGVVEHRVAAAQTHLSPVPLEMLSVAGVLSQPAAPEPEILTPSQFDYTNLATWFEDTDQLLATATDQTSFLIDIPAVEVEQAEVRVGGTALDESLIQYPGTANPGEVGAPVIFGHSVLRQFYRPEITNDRRYVSIFSYIMTLEPGDDIFVTWQGNRYHYQVVSKTEVQPEDVFILQQDRAAKRLKLVTCTPEGTYLRRGVITAELVTS